MAEHATELLQLLAWLFGAISAAVLGLLGWIARYAISKLDARLASMEIHLVSTNATLKAIERELRNDISALDRRHQENFVVIDRRVSMSEARIGRLEERCTIFHIPE